MKKNSKERGTANFGTNKNYIPTEQLTDTPARLYRKILDKLGMNMAMWKSYMTDHLRFIHPDDSGTPMEVKKARGTSLGNANSAYFFSKTLSFNKLIEGLKIIKVKRVTVKIEYELETGDVYEVSETSYLRPSRCPILEDKDE